MTRRSIYEFPEDPSQPSRLVIRPSEARYLFVYPFIKTRAWYMLPKAERQTMMDEHVRVGRKYPSIRLNTTYSYGLDDQEFIVAFEGDNLFFQAEDGMRDYKVTGVQTCALPI